MSGYTGPDMNAIFAMTLACVALIAATVAFAVRSVPDTRGVE